MSTPSSFQGSAPGSLIAHTRISRPLTKIALALGDDLGRQVPWTGVVLEEVGEGLGIGQIVDADDSMSLAPARRGRTRDRYARSR
jgi:hypothetical protein